MRAFHYETIDSTQDEAMRLVKAGESAPFFVHADNQTAGRGRMNRVWHSEKGRSLTMTMVEELASTSLSGLSIFIGYQITDFIRELPLKIKWPNDIILNDKKVGGILISAHTQGDVAIVVIGIGLNLQSMTTADYAGLNLKISAPDLAEKISLALKEFKLAGISPFIPACEKILWKKNERIIFKTSEGERSVTIKGLNEEGFLMTDDGRRLQLEIDGEILFD